MKEWFRKIECINCWSYFYSNFYIDEDDGLSSLCKKCYNEKVDLIVER